MKVIPELDPLDLASIIPPAGVPALVNLNGRIASPTIAKLLNTGSNIEHLGLYVDAMTSLPPIFSSFDFIGNLLKLEKDATSTGDFHLQNLLSAKFANKMCHLASGLQNQRKLVRSVIVEGFIAHCLQVIDAYEREEEGNEFDDQGRTARAIQMVSN